MLIPPPRITTEPNIVLSIYIYSTQIAFSPLPSRELSINTKKPPSHLTDSEASIKTAATYSPTVTQYHRRDKA